MVLGLRRRYRLVCPGFSLGLDVFAIATEQALPLHVHTCMHVYCRVQGIKEITCRRR